MKTALVHQTHRIYSLQNTACTCKDFIFGYSYQNSRVILPFLLHLQLVSADFLTLISTFFNRLSTTDFL